MINGWTILAALVLLGAGAAIGLMTAALLAAAREDAPGGAADEGEVDGE